MIYEVSLVNNDREMKLGKFEAPSGYDAEKKAMALHKTLLRRMQTNTWKVRAKEAK